RRLGAAAIASLLLMAPSVRADEPAPAAEVVQPSAATPADTDRLPLGAATAGGLAGRSPAVVSARSADFTGAGVLRTAASLGFVLALATLGAVVVKRVSRSKGGGLALALGPGGPAPAGVLEVLGRYPVSRGQSLILLRAHNRVLLLAQSPGVRLSRGGAGAMT